MSYYSFATLAEVCSAALFALGLGYVLVFHRPGMHLLSPFKPLLVIASAVSVTTALYYLVLHLGTAHSTQYKALMYLVKDAAGAAGVCMLTLVAVQILVVIEARRAKGIAQLFELAPIVFGTAIIAAAIIALMNPAPDTNLDISSSSWAVAYRIVIGLPSILYANLTAFFFFEGYMRRYRSSTPQESTLLKRYLFISGAAASLGALAILQAAWPASSEAPASTIFQGLAYVAFTVCGLAGLLLQFKPSEIDRSIESFDQYQSMFGQHLAFEVYGLSTETNHLPPHVPSAAAQKELVRTAAQLLRSTPDGPFISEELVDLTQKTLFIAVKIVYDKKEGDGDYLERLRVFADLPDQYSDHIPDHAPQKLLATYPSVVDRAARAARTLTDPTEVNDLVRAPAWVQLAAGFSAVFGQTLPPKLERQILDEMHTCLDPNIRWAVAWTAYSLKRSLA